MALKYRIIYAPSAIYDLDEIYEYIVGKFYAPDTAERQVARIIKAAETLAVFPKMYRVRRKNTGARICSVDNYLIVYSVDDENHTVNISRIIYSRRDIDSMFQL